MNSGAWCPERLNYAIWLRIYAEWLRLATVGEWAFCLYFEMWGKDKGVAGLGVCLITSLFSLIFFLFVCMQGIINFLLFKKKKKKFWRSQTNYSKEVIQYSLIKVQIIIKIIITNNWISKYWNLRGKEIEKWKVTLMTP